MEGNTEGLTSSPERLKLRDGGKGILLSHSPKEEKADLCEPWRPLPLHHLLSFPFLFPRDFCILSDTLFTISSHMSLKLPSYSFMCLASRTAWNWYILEGGFVFSTSSHVSVPPHTLTPQDKPVSQVGSWENTLDGTGQVRLFSCLDPDCSFTVRNHLICFSFCWGFHSHPMIGVWLEPKRINVGWPCLPVKPLMLLCWCRPAFLAKNCTFTLNMTSPWHVLKVNLKV